MDETLKYLNLISQIKYYKGQLQGSVRAWVNNNHDPSRDVKRSSGNKKQSEIPGKRENRVSKGGEKNIPESRKTAHLRDSVVEGKTRRLKWKEVQIIQGINSEGMW